ncbi:hypothetical protein HYN59_16100 [Flavobacterium album]|uniref:Uncharacterized protein n=1 Tax=Flavobacterium album TaxID=2175091 RepID=A0A2S1R1E5_9FLAO|nr:hypothetical protein [Flavobacterium album]AWH86533.1 hypothetical protein HYN59_16100 [Flavobacterium album]
MWLSSARISFSKDYIEIKYGVKKYTIGFSEITEAKIITRVTFGSCIMIVVPLLLPIILIADSRLRKETLLCCLIAFIAVLLLIVAVAKREKKSYLIIKRHKQSNFSFFIESRQEKQPMRCYPAYSLPEN